MNTMALSMRRRLLKVLALTALSWGLAPQAALAQAGDGRAPEVLRIGYQKSAANLVVVKQSGWLEKRLPQTRVAWIEFPAGPQLLEALAVGSLEFGMTGDSPPVFAQAAGKDLVYVGAEPPKPDSSAILVLNDSPLRSVAELKGKRVALQKGSSAHYLLVRAIEKAGLQWSDISPVYLIPADARAAFERKSVDAWAIWDPFLAAVEKQSGARILADGRGVVNNYAYYLAERGYAEKYPQVIQALFDDTVAQGQWLKANIRQAAAIIAPQQGLATEVVELSLTRYQFGVKPVTAAVAAEQQKIADVFHQLGLIPKPIRILDALPGAAQTAQAK